MAWVGSLLKQFKCQVTYKNDLEVLLKEIYTMSRLFWKDDAKLKVA